MSMKPHIPAFALLLATAAAPALAQLQTGEKATAEQVATGEVHAKPVDEREQVHRALVDPARAAVWTRPAATQLLTYVDKIGGEGLRPADYRMAELNAAIAGADPAVLNAVASDVFLRLSADLALGRATADDRTDWNFKDVDLVAPQQYALMAKAIQDNNIADTLASLLPTHPQYAELKGVLDTAKDPAVLDKARVNLDRWRWLPRDLGRRYVIVNVPAYTVALVEDGQVVTRHRVVVGATKTATPSLGAVATGVIFNPWWEVPKSIAPEVRGKRGYRTVKNEDGSVRYRQPPGPGNALGRVKVVMPNNDAIYLHDTPAKALFKRETRAFSHGCIRTENALTFAQTLLGNPQWDKTAIDAAIASGKTVKADAVTPTPVYITYFTAAALKDSAGIQPYADIYGRDAKVVTALNAASKPAVPAVAAAPTLAAVKN